MKIDKNDIKKVCIDDFAIIKRKTYGTVLINIENNTIIDMIDCRECNGISISKELLKIKYVNSEEKKSLLHAAIFAMEVGYPFMEALNSVTSELKMFSNQEQEKVLNRHLVEFEVVSRICNPAVKPILREIEQAVANECSMEIEYCTGYDGHPKHRVVDFYGMIHWNNKWYAIAFCQLRNEIRSFRVDRIANIISTKNSFKCPESFSAREFFTKTYYLM